ncbi:site-2 protease family protein [Candidatus Peregrinibacteria bacterium]|nr:MAG: site-2 protease family protein [Candidatus Peregrinibacteria bacterium]
MSIFFTVLAFLLIFSLLILIHEAGHFFAAKKAGVKVEEFGMGLPPRIWGFKKGETLYSINWIPFGGFVRMLGEGDAGKEAETSKRSFRNQHLRVQAFIVCAGVLMNLMLSFVLLTIGFWVGIEPLIATSDDFFSSLRNGTMQVEPGFVVSQSTSDRIKEGDRILGFETFEEWQSTLLEVEEGTAPELTVLHADGTQSQEVLNPQLLDEIELEAFALPSVVYQDQVDALFHGVLQQGDVLISVKDPEGQVHPLLSLEDFDTALDTLVSPLVLKVYRPNLGTFDLDLILPTEAPVISFVEKGSPAEQAGLQVGDRVVGVAEFQVVKAQQILDLISAHKQSSGTGESIRVQVLKQATGETVTLTILLREDGRMGVGLADLAPSIGKTSVYEGYVPFTLMGMQEVQLGLSAPGVALQEMWRLGKVTAVTFVDVLKQFVTAKGVPEGVSGPVGIAQMTGITIQDGFAATLRFVAMLSLSLGVINILPFPALDGGHFAGILFKAVTGRSGLARWANLVNLAGFVFLLVFILYITFNDVLNLL